MGGVGGDLGAFIYGLMLTHIENYVDVLLS